MFKEKVNARTDGCTTDNGPWHKLAGLWPVELKREMHRYVQLCPCTCNICALNYKMQINYCCLTTKVRIRLQRAFGLILNLRSFIFWQKQHFNCSNRICSYCLLNVFLTDLLFSHLLLSILARKKSKSSIPWKIQIQFIVSIIIVKDFSIVAFLNNHSLVWNQPDIVEIAFGLLVTFSYKGAILYCRKLLLFQSRHLWGKESPTNTIPG